MDCKKSKFVWYEKVYASGRIRMILGLEVAPRMVRKQIDFNQFEEEPTKVPKGWRKQKVSPSWVAQFGCDPKRQPLPASFKPKHPRGKSYFTHDNMSRPFLVFLVPGGIEVFRRPELPGDKYYVPEGPKAYERDKYVVPVGKYRGKVIIGNSPKNHMTEYSCGHGPAFNGNSFLVDQGKGKYVFVGESVFSFQTPAGDKIIEYYSPVGNNDVPYPVAIGKENAYFLIENAYVPLKFFPRKLTKRIKSGLYSLFYGHCPGATHKKRDVKRFPKRKMIQERLL